MKKNRRNTMKKNRNKRDTTEKTRKDTTEETKRDTAKESRRGTAKESKRGTAKKIVKKIFEAINAYNAVSILSLIVSIFTFCWTYSIEEKTFKSDTYSLDLSYQINISDKIDKENILVFENYIRISAKDFIKVLPKTGGISKFGIVFPQPYYKNDFHMEFFNTAGLSLSLGEESFREAQYLTCIIEDFVLPFSDEYDDKYYSSFILIIEDYKHNFFSNLIVFEFDKKDLTNINTRIYDKIHLFLTLNDIQSIPDFDLKQLKRYSDFIEKMKELNIEF